MVLIVAPTHNYLLVKTIAILRARINVRQALPCKIAPHNILASRIDKWLAVATACVVVTSCACIRVQDRFNSVDGLTRMRMTLVGFVALTLEELPHRLVVELGLFLQVKDHGAHHHGHRENGPIEDD